MIRNCNNFLHLSAKFSTSRRGPSSRACTWADHGSSPARWQQPRAMAVIHATDGGVPCHRGQGPHVSGPRGTDPMLQSRDRLRFFRFVPLADLALSWRWLYSLRLNSLRLYSLSLLRLKVPFLLLRRRLPFCGSSESCSAAVGKLHCCHCF